MVSERQRIEAAPTPTMETPPPPFSPPPPSYEEVNNNTSPSPMQNGSNDGGNYFLGEVCMHTYKLTVS